MQDRATRLDELIPLRGASHADVVGYATDIPMRYTECCAVLADGRKVRLENSRQFLGWCSRGGTMDLLFDGGGRRVEVKLDKSEEGPLRDVIEWRNTSGLNGAGRQFVMRDGSQVGVKLTERFAEEPRRSRNIDVPVLDPYPEWLALKNRAAMSQ